MEYFYLTDPGKLRTHNEDSVIVTENENGEYLLVVADGMGGHKAGEVASSIVVSNLGKRFKECGSIGTKEDAVNWLKEAVSEANMLIYKHTSEHPESAGMGTTVVVSVLTKEYLLFGNIGDSSGYVVKKGKLHKITTDHTLVNLLLKTGQLTEAEAKNHPRKNVLMRALGATTSVDMDIFDVETDIEGIFLCSDGLTNMLSDGQIEKVLEDDITIEQKLQKLVSKSNNRGGLDNISIAYLSIGGV